MALTSTHPSYDNFRDDWELMRDAYAGERVVKAKGTKYLPATEGQVLDGQGSGNAQADGERAYEAYKLRAVFPEHVSEAVQEYIGLLHKRPAVFTLPKKMEPLLDRVTTEGEGLLALLRRINTEQLTSGRLGLLLDLPEGATAGALLPYVAVYYGETIPNWDSSHDKQGIDELSLVVLNESGTKRVGLDWTPVTRYRVLRLADPAEYLAQGNPELTAVIKQPAVPDPAGSIYVQALFEEKDSSAEGSLEMYKAPVYLGTPLSTIPFVFINAGDTVSEPDKPPLISLGRLCMTIYRGEADYRHNLYMQSQDTLVTIGTLANTSDKTNTGGVDAIRVGAGAHIGVDMGGDAKYIGVTATGISEQRSAIENDEAKAEGLAGKLIAPGAGKQESGEALTTRMSAQTASLRQIAVAGAQALQQVLRIAAEWLGEDPLAVEVTPNLEFADTRFVPKELVDTMTARTQGAPISLETIHENLQKMGVTQKTYQEEIDLIAEEDAESTLRAAAKMAVLNRVAPPQPQPANQPPANRPQQ